MKIVFIIADLANGGAEKILANLANHFIVKKHNITIVTLSSNDSFYKLEQNIKHIKLDLLYDSTSFADSILNNIKRVRKIRKVIKDENPDIVISFLTQTNILSILSDIGLKIPIIISERSIYQTENNNKLWRILRKITYPLADFLTVLTKKDSYNYDFVKNKMVIPNFVNINENSYNLEKENVILAVGRLHPVKQFDKLIDIYSKLNTTYRLIIVGEGNEREKLENKIKNLNLENKVFLEGQKKNVYEYYKKAKIFVLTSKHEAFPNVLLEASYFGCAIVGFDCDYGPSAIIENGINGILIENQNKDEFVVKLQNLLNDNKLQKKLSINAKENVKKFQYDKIIKKWEKLIEDVKNPKR